MIPPTPQSVEELEEVLSRPTGAVVDALSRLDGDLVLLGAGGKMGPTMARMAVRGLCEAGSQRRVHAVSRFSDPAIRQQFEQLGVATHAVDLLAPDAESALPEAAHVISMSGFKFGAAERPHWAWATNCHIPSVVVRRYRQARIVAFSTGNVYGLTTPASGGSKETDPPGPIGEYAWSALGRERMFQFHAEQLEAAVLLLRLNYATELRYGVLVDLAQQIQSGEPVPIGMSHVNVLWLADANAMTLRSLALPRPGCQVLNLAGPEVLRVRDVCEALAERMQCEWTAAGEESPTSLLNNGHAAYDPLGAPEVDSRQMIAWTADWVAAGRPLLGRPTKFQVTDGQF